MLLTIKRAGYDRTGDQVASGKYLIMMQTDKPVGTEPIKCLVRFTHMRQLGHWMMGKVRVNGKTFTVSGAYGSDGLPLTVPQEIYELGIELPADLENAYNEGGGWNGAGAEAKAIHNWAAKAFKLKIPLV